MTVGPGLQVKPTTETKELLQKATVLHEHQNKMLAEVILPTQMLPVAIWSLLP